MTFQDVIRISLELSKTPTSQRLHPHLSISRHFGITWTPDAFTFSLQPPEPEKQKRKKNNRLDLDKVVLHSCPR